MSSPSSVPSPTSHAPPVPSRTPSPLRPSPTTSSTSGDTVSFRELRRDDFPRGFPAILSQLTALGDISQEQFETQFDRQVVCTASLLIEPKFIHGCGLVGHIEDVVVDQHYRGRNLGARVISELLSRSRAAGCYKTILDCAEKNVPFYEGCGFKRASAHMACYHTENDVSVTPAASSAVPTPAGNGSVSCAAGSGMSDCSQSDHPQQSGLQVRMSVAMPTARL